MKITPADREKILAFYGSQMSVSEITRQLNKGKDKKLQFSRQAVSKILGSGKSLKNVKKFSKSSRELRKDIINEIKNKRSVFMTFCLSYGKPASLPFFCSLKR